jgi:hypothetical protein
MVSGGDEYEGCTHRPLVVCVVPVRLRLVRVIPWSHYMEGLEGTSIRQACVQRSLECPQPGLHPTEHLVSLEAFNTDPPVTDR